MARSIKLKNENYIDSTGIVHNKEKLSTVLDNLKAKVLYENTGGTNGNITLNDSSANYTYIEVYYRNNDGFYGFKRFYKPNNRNVVLNSFYLSNSNIVFKLQSRKFSGKSFNVLTNGEVSITAITYIKTTANTYVTLVIGYK